MFACYDELANPTIFRKVLCQLPTQKSFPQEMCQLLVKDFQLHFGADKVSNDKNSINNYQVRLLDLPLTNIDCFEQKRLPKEGCQTSCVVPYIQKKANSVLFVQAYLLPVKQLTELVAYLTGCTESSSKIVIPEKMSFRQPFLLPKTDENSSSFYNCLTKVSPFENLDVLCLTRTESKKMP